MCKQFECGESTRGFVRAENNTNSWLRTKDPILIQSMHIR